MNRKKTAAFILLSILLLSIPVNASNSLKKTVDILYGIALQINGKAPALQDANGQPVSPFTLNGTTYVPIRAVATELGYDVSYDAKSNTATVRKTSIAAFAADALPVYQLFQGEIFNAYTVLSEISILQHLHSIKTDDSVLTSGGWDSALRDEYTSIDKLQEKVRASISFFEAIKQLSTSPQYAIDIADEMLLAYGDMEVSLIHLYHSVSFAFEYRNTSNVSAYNTMRDLFNESISALKGTNTELTVLYHDVSGTITEMTRSLY